MSNNKRHVTVEAERVDVTDLFTEEELREMGLWEKVEDSE